MHFLCHTSRDASLKVYGVLVFALVVFFLLHNEYFCFWRVDVNSWYILNLVFLLTFFLEGGHLSQLMKFIHCADIHLDSPLKGLERYEGAPVAEIRNASRQAFEALVSLALDESVDFVLIAGDLFDGAWRDFNTALYFIKQIIRLQAVDIPVFLVRGNHDAQSRFVQQMRFPDNLHLFPANKSVTYLLDGLRVAIHGQSFAKPDERSNLAQGFPPAIPGYYNIGLLHTALNGRDGHERYAPCAVVDLESQQYDYWALGHVHQWEIVQSGSPWILFPGVVQGRHAREVGPKGCALVTVNQQLQSFVEFRAVDSLRWQQIVVDLHGVERVEQVLERLKSALSQAVEGAEGRILAVRLIFDACSPLLQQQILRHGEGRVELQAVAMEVAGGMIWVEKIIFSKPPASIGVTEGVEALADLDAIRAELVADPKALIDLGQQLWGPLRGILPASLTSGEDRMRFDEAEWCLEILDRAEALAKGRLSGGGQ